MTRGQASSYGVGRHSQQRLVDRGDWRLLTRGVLYTYPTSPDWQAMAWAGVLRGGRGARLAGRAAAHLHGLVDEAPGRIVVLVPLGTVLRAEGPWAFRQERPGVRRGQTVGAPPRTLIEDTVLDLCDGQFSDGRRRSATHWVTTAVQRQLTTPERLRAALDTRRRITCRVELSALLTDVDAGVQSPLERRYLRRVERPHGLPVGSRQAPAVVDGRRARRDIRYADHGLLVELDGTDGHIGEGRFRDYRRDNAAAVDGEITLRYGWADVNERPCRVAHQVALLLRRGGWRAPFRRCPSCPADLQ